LGYRRNIGQAHGGSSSEVIAWESIKTTNCAGVVDVNDNESDAIREQNRDVGNYGILDEREVITPGVLRGRSRRFHHFAEFA
jgi:hypothetical protein